MAEERAGSRCEEKQNVEHQGVTDPVPLVRRQAVDEERHEDEQPSEHGESPGVQRLDQSHGSLRILSTVHRGVERKKAMLG